MFRKIVFVLMALFSLTLQAQQRLSGKVTDANGPVDGAHVVELDKSNRVLNQTYTNASGVYVLPLRLTKTTVKVVKDGYEAVIVQVNNQGRLNFTLVPHESQSVTTLQTLKNAPAVESSKLIVGHDARGKNVTQYVRIEQMNDSTYILCTALVPKEQTSMYPAGKKFLFVNLMDQKLLSMQNVQDCYPIAGAADEMEMAIHSPQAEQRYAAGTGLSHSTQYHLFPCFKFSKKDMDVFLAKKAEQTYRVAIETDGGGGYWFMYPTENFVKELKNMMNKLQK